MLAYSFDVKTTWLVGLLLTSVFSNLSVHDIRIDVINMSCDNITFFMAFLLMIE
jgi:hypothetical protein